MCIRTDFIPVFTIYKDGTTTNGPVTILRKVGETFNISQKIAFYQYLGYTVTVL